MNGQRVAVWLSCIALGLTSCGCSGVRTAHGKVRVSGKVTYEGRPLGRGTVTFSGKDNLSGMSAIDPYGRYSLQVFPGNYDVAIRCEGPGETASNGRFIPGKSLIPQRYDDIRTSGLSVSVGKARQQENFELTP